MKQIKIRTAEFNKKGLADMIKWVTRPNSGLSNISMVEIGCYVGEGTQILSPYVNSITCVDPWVNGYDDHDGASFRHNMDDVKAVFDENVKGLQNVTVLREYSTVAAEMFDDRSLDFVYIDGEHTYKAVKADIEAWFPKVKKGGYIGGHDLTMRGVAMAVFENFELIERVFSDSSWLYKVK